MLKAVTNLRQILSLGSYLQYAKERSLGPTSTVFRGTLYEFLVGEHLKDDFSFQGLKRVGGPSDKGLDLQGKWALRDLKSNGGFQKSSICISEDKSVTCNREIPSKSLQSSPQSSSKLSNSLEFSRPDFSLEARPSSDLPYVLVQCKNTTRKVAGKLIRELSGIYNYHTTPLNFQHGLATPAPTLMVLVTPSLLTPAGRSEFNAAHHPLIYCKTSHLSLKQGQDPYKLDAWELPKIELFELNALAVDLLSHMDVQACIRDLLVKMD
mgnify:CR=1 FL=1